MCAIDECLTDLIENHEYEIPAWVRTCLRGVRQEVRAALTSSAAPQAQAAPPPNLEPQCGAGEVIADLEKWADAHTYDAQVYKDERGQDWQAHMLRHQHSAAALRAAIKRISALQATAGRGSSPTPIDDGAVERGQNG